MKKILVFIVILMMSYTVNAQRIVSDVTEGNTRTVTCNYEPISEFVSVSLSAKIEDNNLFYYYLNFHILDKTQDYQISDNYNEKLTVTTVSGSNVTITNSNGVKVEGNNKKYKVNNELVKLYNISVSFLVTDYLDQIIEEGISSITLQLEPYAYLIKNTYDEANLINTTRDITKILDSMRYILDKKLQ